MKKLIFVFFALCCMAGTTMAQGGRRGHHSMNPEQMAKHRTERMTKQLDLTQEQAVAIQAIYTKQAEQMQQMHKVKEGDRKELRAKMQEARKAREEQMQQILTKEQYAKWKELEAAGHPHHGRPGGRRGGHPGGQRSGFSGGEFSSGELPESW